MNSERINDQIRECAEIGAKLDFADLLRLIEEDGGRSTAPQMHSSGGRTGKIIGVAAGLVAVTALSAATITMLASGMSKAESSFAAEIMDAEAPSCEYSSDSFYSDEELIADSAAPTENIIFEEPEEWLSGSDVSDSDVSDSDVSGSEIPEDVQND